VPPEPEPEPDVEYRVKRQFQPSQTVSMMKYGSGNYVNLFATESYAVWVDQEVMELKRQEALAAGEQPPARLQDDAVAISEDFIILECHVVSEFNDMSVAYDVVRNRGVDVYLVSPDGKKVPPLQMQTLGPIEEESVDALRRFSTTQVAIFPRENLWVGTPTVEPNAAQVQLVFETHNATFFFEWPGGLSETVQKTPLSVQDRARAVRTGFNDLYGNIRRLAHMFS
jgi:hypothetical protein